MDDRWADHAFFLLLRAAGISGEDQLHGSAPRAEQAHGQGPPTDTGRTSARRLVTTALLLLLPLLTIVAGIAVSS